VALKSPDLEKLPLTTPGTEVRVATATGKPGDAPAATISPAAMTALTEAIAKPAFGALTALPLAYKDGGLRLMLQVYVAGAKAPDRVAWLVRGKDGQDASRGDEPARAERWLEGFVVDRALPLHPGEYDVAVALFDESGAVTHTARRSVAAPGATAELSSSPLFLAIADLPAPSATAETPFVFSGRKFVGKGDAKVVTTDGLSYMVRVYGPGIDPETKKAFLKRRVRVQPKGGAAMDLASAPDEPIAIKPGAEGTVVLDVAGSVVDANIGQYFHPGDYTLKVSVEDVVRKAKLEVSEPFTIVAAPKK